MAKRFYNVATALSVITAALLMIAWIAGGFVDSTRHFLTVGRAFHVSIERRHGDVRLFFFNDVAQGPHADGGILSASPLGSASGPKRHGFDLVGMYCQRYVWPDGSVVWRFAISLLYPLLASAVLPIAWLVRRSRRPRRGFEVGGPAAAG